MKYDIDEIASKTTIKNYEKKGNKIKLNFIDGGFLEVSNNTINEKQIQSLMTKQAEIRDSSSQLEKISSIKKSYEALGMIATTMSSAIFFGNFNSNENILFLSGLTALAALWGWGGFVKSKKEEKDIEKYNIYLDIKEELEQPNSNYFNSIKRKKINNLNINTIDKFSLKEMKIIRDNIERVKIHDEICNHENILSRKLEK